MCVEIPREKTREDLGEWEERNGTRSGGEGGGFLHVLRFVSQEQRGRAERLEVVEHRCVSGKMPGESKRLEDDKGQGNRWKKGLEFWRVTTHSGAGSTKVDRLSPGVDSTSACVSDRQAPATSFR